MKGGCSLRLVFASPLHGMFGDSDTQRRDRTKRHCSFSNDAGWRVRVRVPPTMHASTRTRCTLATRDSTEAEATVETRKRRGIRPSVHGQTLSCSCLTAQCWRVSKQDARSVEQVRRAPTLDPQPCPTRISSFPARVRPQPASCRPRRSTSLAPPDLGGC